MLIKRNHSFHVTTFQNRELCNVMSDEKYSSRRCLIVEFVSWYRISKSGNNCPNHRSLTNLNVMRKYPQSPRKHFTNFLGKHSNPSQQETTDRGRSKPFAFRLRTKSTKCSNSRLRPFRNSLTELHLCSI